MVDPLIPPDELPTHVLRARQSLLRPQGQFSLRSIFGATLVLAVLSLVVRWSSGSAMLTFIPLCGALVTVMGILALLYRIKPLENAVVGGLAVSSSIGLLAMVPLWIQEGLDQKLERGRVDWERVSAPELLWPYLYWLLGLSFCAVVGMVTAGVAAAIYHWQRRRALATASLPREAASPERRFLEVRREVAAYRPQGITLLLLSLLAGGGLSGYALYDAIMYGGANMLGQIDFACWLAAIVATLALLVVVRQLSQNDGVLVGGAVLLLSFVAVSTLPIWRYQAGEPQPMVGYAVLVRNAETMPGLLPLVVYTLSGWLMRCLSYAALGAVLGAVLIAIPKKRRRAIVEMPLPNSADDTNSAESSAIET